MMSPGVMAGFVDIVELLGVVPDEFDMDEGDGVVQVIHDHKRRLSMFYKNQEILEKLTKNASIYLWFGTTIATVGVFGSGKKRQSVQGFEGLRAILLSFLLLVF